VSKEIELSQEVKSRLKPISKSGLKLKPIPRVSKALIIALDVSYSMSLNMPEGHSKLHSAWIAFKNVLTKHLMGWNLGIIAFGVNEAEGVEWLLPPTSRADFDHVKEPEPQDGTPMLKALRESWSWLEKRAEGGRIILITDGIPTDCHPDEILSEAPQHHIPIDCIGCGSPGFGEYDPVFLRKLSESTSGIFCEVRNAESLTKTILELSPARRSLLGSPRGQPGEA